MVTQKHQDKSKFLETIIADLPKNPGVYQMIDSDNNVIYVGKAKDLKKRVSSYFRQTNTLDQRKKIMVQKICDIKYIVVNSELEALVLETNLIKELRPRYNVLMKDDKNYVYVRVSVNEDFPRISLVRKIYKDGAKYFGPKTESYELRESLKFLKKLFPYRHCQLDITWNPDAEEKVLIGNKVIRYPCLDFHIKRCVGPCVGTVTPDEYRLLVDRVLEFLEGKYESLVADLTSEMQKLALDKKFEQAAAIRDKINFIVKTREKQTVSAVDGSDLDVINFVSEQGQTFVNLFQVRAGLLVAQENFIFGRLDHGELSNIEVLEQFLGQYYTMTSDIPSQILLPETLLDFPVWEDVLSKLAGHQVKIKIPVLGRKNDLLNLAFKNAESYARQMRVKWLSDQRFDREEALLKIRDLLSLPKIPRRIECYDISHLSGTETVGAMVVYENGLAKNKDYRHFQIRDLPQNGSLAKPDDFLSLAEVLRRRLKYCVKLKKQLKLKKINGGFELVNQENKKILATINLNPVSDLIAKLDFDFMDKADFIPVLKAIITRSKFKKYYLAIALEKFSPVPFADFNMQIDRTDSSRYVLETSKFSLVDQSLNLVPDLIVIDGGKGQLSAVKKVVKEIGMNELNLCSLAKKKEEIFLPNKPSSIILADHSPEKFLLTQIRDETHRFAITHNRKRRDAKITESSLDQIPGIGEKTKMKLIKHFGTVDAVFQADLNDLTMVANSKVAKAIKKV